MNREAIKNLLEILANLPATFWIILSNYYKANNTALVDSIDYIEYRTPDKTMFENVIKEFGIDGIKFILIRLVDRMSKEIQRGKELTEALIKPDIKSYDMEHMKTIRDSLSCALCFSDASILLELTDSIIKSYKEIFKEDSDKFLDVLKESSDVAFKDLLEYMKDTFKEGIENTKPLFEIEMDYFHNLLSSSVLFANRERLETLQDASLTIYLLPILQELKEKDKKLNSVNLYC